VRVLREGAVIYTSKLNSLKRFKDDASEVRTGFGMRRRRRQFQRHQVGDVLECFSVSKMKRAEAAGQSGGSAGRNNRRLSPERHMPVVCSPSSCTSRDAQSLKDSGKVLRSLKDKLRRDFNVAVAELEHHDTWQRSVWVS